MLRVFKYMYICLRRQNYYILGSFMDILRSCDLYTVSESAKYTVVYNSTLG